MEPARGLAGALRIRRRGGEEKAGRTIKTAVALLLLLLAFGAHAQRPPPTCGLAFGGDGGNSGLRYLDCPPAAGALSNPFTVAFWVKLASPQVHYNRVLDFNNGAGVDEIAIYWCDSTISGCTTDPTASGLQMLVFNGTVTGSEVFLLSGADAVPVNQFVHIALVFSATDGAGAMAITPYRDGVAKGALAMAPVPNVQRAQNWIGRSPFGGQSLTNATLFDVRVYGAALTAAEVQLVYAGLPVPQRPLRLWYRLDEPPTARTAADSSGNAADAALAGELRFTGCGASLVLDGGSLAMNGGSIVFG